MNFEWKNLEWQHEVEFESEEIGEVPALRKLQIDATLCDTLSISKTKNGRYFAIWDERSSKAAQRVPTKHFLTEISLREAYEIIASFWLPEEFHAEAGV